MMTLALLALLFLDCIAFYIHITTCLSTKNDYTFTFWSSDSVSAWTNWSLVTAFHGHITHWLTSTTSNSFSQTMLQFGVVFLCPHLTEKPHHKLCYIPMILLLHVHYIYCKVCSPKVTMVFVISLASQLKALASTITKLHLSLRYKFVCKNKKHNDPKRTLHTSYTLRHCFKSLASEEIPDWALRNRYRGFRQCGSQYLPSITTVQRHAMEKGRLFNFILWNISKKKHLKIIITTI